MDTQEAVSKDPALQKAPELALDESRRGTIPIACSGEERFDALRDDLIEDGLVGSTGTIGGRGTASPGVEAR